jgi:Fe-S cluster biogenesis protein NfuA
LVSELRSSAQPATWALAEEALGLVAQLYGGALDRILEILVDAEATPLIAEIVHDELVSSLLVLHGLHPDDLPTRVQNALDSVRPYLESHGGDVELIAVIPSEGIVKVRLLGSCDGCPSSSVTLKLSVEQAINEAAPEIVDIQVEGYVDPTAPVAAPLPASAPIQLSVKPVAANR